MNKFLETYSPPKLNQEEIDNLKWLITRSETESVIKTTPYKQKSRTRWLHRQILPNVQRTNTDPFQRIFLKTKEEGTLSKTFYEATITLITKPKILQKKNITGQYL